jgi:hypothetical protein
MVQSLLLPHNTAIYIAIHNTNQLVPPFFGANHTAAPDFSLMRRRSSLGEELSR